MDIHYQWSGLHWSISSCKSRQALFFLYYLYAVLRAANEVKEFRFRTDKTDRWSITIRWTSYHLSLYPARLSTQSASLTMQILNGFMPKHITSSITSPKRVTRMEPKSHYRTGRFWYYPTECHASALFHFTHLYTNGSRPSIRLSADECRQSSATRRKTGNAHRFHCKPCFCGRSAHRTTLSENRGDIERAGSINRGVSKA